ncbi:MAG: helix-turn-helix transcriptional regulator [Chlorobi bacterium]|nr:helix-turn-helix transcriptional regulator [Chlorobiota bacterium]
MGYLKRGKKYPSLEEQRKKIREVFNRAADPELEYFTDYSMGIAAAVGEELKRRGLTQKDLARQLNKSESEISKWLSGTHNFTLRSIAKLSAALGKKLIFTESDAKKTFTSLIEIYVNPRRRDFENVPYEPQTGFEEAGTNQKIPA